MSFWGSVGAFLSKSHAIPKWLAVEQSRGELICDSRVLEKFVGIWGIGNLYVMSLTFWCLRHLGSFDALLSKSPVTQNGCT